MDGHTDRARERERRGKNQGMVVHICNARIWEAEAGGLPEV